MKVHKLSSKKKRELENTLRDFASSVSVSAQGDFWSGGNNTSSMGRKSKRTSSILTGRPTDSAYASMSNTGHSAVPNVAKNTGLLSERAALNIQPRSIEQKVQSYLEGVPEGLYLHHMILTESDKKKLVVKRLEKIFTGKMGGRGQAAEAARRQPLFQMDCSTGQGWASLPAILPATVEDTREAPMLSSEPLAPKKDSPTEHVSTSASAADQSDGRGVTTGSGNGSGHGRNGSGSARSGWRGARSSPKRSLEKYEQRPTRPSDLDPDRILAPSENMKYMRHLGLATLQDVSETVFSGEDVAPDAEGWVWLNLLCNMAQLHILNVTPSFIRNAVSEKSVKFQISPDGQKIRWRGGTEGTRFTSDSSGTNSGRERSTDEEAWEEAGLGAPRKRAKTHSTSAVPASSGTGSSNSRGKPLHKHNANSNIFHYKPLFTHEQSMYQISDEAVSVGGIDSNGNSNSRWESSGIGTSSCFGSRHVEGSIIYYDGAPFCTDLSRDPAVVLSMPSTPPPDPSSREASSPSRPITAAELNWSRASRSLSCSLIHRPPVATTDVMEVDENDSEEDIVPGSDDEEMFTWGEPTVKPQRPRISKLEAAGLGGIVPEDHFLVHVVTRRPKLKIRHAYKGAHHDSRYRRWKADDATDAIVSRIADLKTSSPDPPSRTSFQSSDSVVDIQYLHGRTKKLEPSPLPPPATYLPPFSSDEDEDDNDDIMDIDLNDEQDESSEVVHLADPHDTEEVLSRLANPHLRENSTDDELTSGDEEDEVDPEAGYEASESSDPNMVQQGCPSGLASSVATAGGGVDSERRHYRSSDGDDLSMH